MTIRPSQTLKERREMMTALTLIAPAIIAMVTFLYTPFANALQANFYKYSDLGALGHFVGLKNYARILAGPKFVRSLWNTFYLIMVSLLVIPIGFVFAYILYMGIPDKKVFNAGLFIPYPISMVVVGCIWRVTYGPVIGPVDQFLKMAGLEKYTKAWLSRLGTTLWTIVITRMWRPQPFNMLIMYANITKILEDFPEAAQVDDANFRQKLFYIIVPHLKPIFVVLTVPTVTNGLRLFDLVWVMTQGGPGSTSDVMTSYIYTKAFINRDFGAGTAASVMLMLIMVAIMAVRTIV